VALSIKKTEKGQIEVKLAIDRMTKRSVTTSRMTIGRTTIIGMKRNG
jgi:hypothetical protein